MTTTKILPLPYGQQGEIRLGCGHAATEVAPPRFEFVDGQVLMFLTTETGDAVTFAMTAGTFMDSINAAVVLMNENLSVFLKEIAGF
jgi:hypothetical protein